MRARMLDPNTAHKLNHPARRATACVLALASVLALGALSLWASPAPAHAAGAPPAAEAPIDESPADTLKRLKASLPGLEKRALELKAQIDKVKALYKAEPASSLKVQLARENKLTDLEHDYAQAESERLDTADEIAAIEQQIKNLAQTRVEVPKAKDEPPPALDLKQIPRELTPEQKAQLDAFAKEHEANAQQFAQSETERGTMRTVVLYGGLAAAGLLVILAAVLLLKRRG
jgi:Spy/CpxP family protein refolding chaperone